MGSRVKGIYYKPENLENGISTEKAFLVKEYGIKGDIHGGKEKRNISILFESTRKEIENLPVKGLCTERFKENITLSGEINLIPGDVLKAENSQIRITETGKKCFRDCDIYSSGFTCPLRKVIFGEVIKSGEIKIGDEIEIIVEG